MSEAICKIFMDEMKNLPPISGEDDHIVLAFREGENVEEKGRIASCRYTRKDIDSMTEDEKHTALLDYCFQVNSYLSLTEHL